MNAFILTWLWVLLISCYANTAISPNPSHGIAAYRPIRIGLAIDEHSRKEIHVLMSSVITAAYNKSDIVFHILVCGKDELTARRLKTEVEEQLSACFIGVRLELKAFFLAPDSGFGAQLSILKRKAHHWNSQSGADMARFFLAEMFPHAERLLYLDNDIIVSCCLEEIFDSDLAGQAVGLALDDLNWAVMTQFQRHYNASHPLVIQHMRRQHTDYYRSIHQHEEISKYEFAKSVPKYPNDGVLLIDVARFNNLSVLRDMDRIALANAEGEYAVNVGTQQFTVLTLFDRWKEITPRANLRHFPDMARGYLMWFYYTGFLHYAGAAKPRTLCHVDSFKDNNWHRVQSLTPWLLSSYLVGQQCPQRQALQHCHRHLLLARNPYAMLKLLFMLVDASGSDRQLLYLRLGSQLGAVDRKSYEGDLAALLPRFRSMDSLPVNLNSTQLSCSDAERLQVLELKLLELVDKVVLHSTQWDMRLLGPVDDTSSTSTRSVLQPFNQFYQPAFQLPQGLRLGASAGAGKAGKQSKQRRQVSLQTGRWCMNHHSHTTYIPAAVAEAFSSDGMACQSVLQEAKAAGYKHWEPVLVTVAYGSNSASLAVLYALDLVFMRPKLLLVALKQESSLAKLQEQVDELRAFLTRTGFMPGQSVQLDCINSARSIDRSAVVVYVWGIRMNLLEYQ